MTDVPSGSELHCFTSSHHERHEVGSRIGIRLDGKASVEVLADINTTVMRGLRGEGGAA